MIPYIFLENFEYRSQSVRTQLERVLIGFKSNIWIARVEQNLCANHVFADRL